MWQLLSSTNQDRYTSRNVEFESLRKLPVIAKMVREEASYIRHSWRVTQTENGFIARGDDDFVIRYEIAEGV